VRKPRFERHRPRGPGPRVTPGAHAQHQPRDEARAQLARLTGVALVAVTGIAASLAQTIISAVGTDMRVYPD
jgi:hypothetical protein